MGGSWDATNVADAAVAVVLPVAVDHAHVPRRHARATIARREGRDHQARRRSRSSPSRRPRSPRCCSRRAAEVGATVAREGIEFGVVSRVPGRRRPDAVAAGPAGARTTRSSCRCTAPTRRRTPRSRWPRSRRSSAATQPLDEELVRAAFAEVTSPGPARDHPAQPDDRARRRAQPARRRGARPPRSRTRSRSRPLIGVIGVMADKDHEGLLAAFEPHLAHVVCTQNSTERAMPAARAGRGRPRGLRRGPGHASRRAWPTRSTRPRRWPRPARCSATALGSGGVLVTGSVVTVGEARAMLRGAGHERAARPARRAAACAPRSCCLEAIVLGLTTPVMVTIADVDAGTALRDRARARPSPACCWPGCCAAEWAYALGWAVQVAAIGLGFVVPIDVLPRRGLRAAVGHGVLPRPQDRARAGRGVRRARGGDRPDPSRRR